MGGKPAPHVEKLIEANRRAAKPRQCPRCGAPVLNGDDDDRCTIRANVNPDPVGLVDEMLAIFDGLTTYDLVRGALYRREPWHVHSTREPRWPIHVEHRCERNRVDQATDDALPGM